MKKILSIAALLIVLSTSQSAEAQVSIAYKGSLNFNRLAGNITHMRIDVGYAGGITVEYKLSDPWVLQATPSIAIKKARTSTKSYGPLYTEKYSPVYAHLPIHVGYRLWVGNETSLLFHAGPYGAYAISGRYWKEIDQRDAISTPRTHMFDKDGLNYNRLDYGAGGGMSLEYVRVAFDLSFDRGFRNMSNKAGETAYMQSISFAMSYKF